MIPNMDRQLRYHMMRLAYLMNTKISSGTIDSRILCNVMHYFAEKNNVKMKGVKSRIFAKKIMTKTLFRHIIDK